MCDNKDALVSSISTLCSLNKKFHCNKREHELKSLTKYIKEFKNFSQEEFISFVCRYYVKSLRERKRFCSQSIYNRISAIQSRIDLTVLTRRRYNSVLKSLRKLFNPYSKETTFYTNTGTIVEIPADEFKQLRENSLYLIEQNHTNQADRWILNTYTDEEIETVYKYFLLNLQNFITSVRDVQRNYDDMIFIELCLLIVFSYNTPRRVAEILDLRMHQIEHLILHNTLNIKSKDGFSIDCIYISNQLSDILNRFLTKVYPNDSFRPDEKLFHATYKMYYTRMRNTLKTLIGEHRLRNLRIFHGFRNYYANKHLADHQECQQVLGHRNLSMTRRYARGHVHTASLEAKKKNKVLEYLNKV